MKPRYSTPRLSELADNGFWFCRTCKTVTQPVEIFTGQNGCTHCSSPALQWNPPVFVEPSEPQKTMNAQYFVVRFESDTNTRWQAGPKELASTLELLARAAADIHSEGSRPAVRVKWTGPDELAED